MFGLASKFTVECDNDECDYKDRFESCHKLHKGTGTTYSINRQFALAMCAIGRHYQHLTRLTANLDMPAPLSEVPWRNSIKEIGRVTTTVAQCSMYRTADEVHKAEQTISDITLSCDNTWQRHGFA